MAKVSLSGIEKVYPGDVRAVSDFNLEIADREFIVFVGPSGCGKSTTLRMIAGLEEISAGSLFIGDKCVNEVPARARDITMVFQNYALYPYLTVYENMAFGLKVRKESKTEIEQKVREAARILGIEELLGRKPKTLSGGQRQRVALGRAMVRKSSVFLLDEPLSNLDASLRNAMREELIALHKKLGTTFIYVTHDQVEAMTMGDRIVVMDRGKIQQVDSPENLYKNPKNRFVAGFIGSPPMNFLEGMILQVGTEYYVDLAGERLLLPMARFAEETLAVRVGERVIVGIRAEDIMDGKDRQTAAHRSLNVEVMMCELLGDKSYVYAAHKAGNIVSRFGADGAEMGARRLEVKVEAIHLFDAQSELSLCRMCEH